MNSEEFNKTIKPLADKWADDLVKDGLVNEDGTIPVSEWRNLSVPFDESNNLTISSNFTYTIRLTNNDGKKVGEFDFSGDKLKFEGDVHESAEIVINYLLHVFNQKIEQNIDKASLKAYENGYNDAYDYYKEKGQIV